MTAIPATIKLIASVVMQQLTLESFSLIVQQTPNDVYLSMATTIMLQQLLSSAQLFACFVQVLLLVLPAIVDSTLESMVFAIRLVWNGIMLTVHQKFAKAVRMIVILAIAMERALPVTLLSISE